MTSPLNILLCLFAIFSLSRRIFHRRVLVCARSRISDNLGLALQHLAILICSSGIDAVNPSLVKENEEHDIISEASEAMDYEAREVRSVMAERLCRQN